MCAPLLSKGVCVVKNVLMLASSTIRDELHHLVWNPRLWNQLSTDFHWRSNEPTTNLQTIHFGTRSSLITGRSTYQYPYTKKYLSYFTVSIIAFTTRKSIVVLIVFSTFCNWMVFTITVDWLLVMMAIFVLLVQIDDFIKYLHWFFFFSNSFFFRETFIIKKGLRKIMCHCTR